MSDRIRRDQDDIEDQDLLESEDGDVLEAAFDEDDELDDDD